MRLALCVASKCVTERNYQKERERERELKLLSKPTEPSVCFEIQAYRGTEGETERERERATERTRAQ